jgi:hypothetical protein
MPSSRGQLSALWRSVAAHRDASASCCGIWQARQSKPVRDQELHTRKTVILRARSFALAPNFNLEDPGRGHDLFTYAVVEGLEARETLPPSADLNKGAYRLCDHRQTQTTSRGLFE